MSNGKNLTNINFLLQVSFVSIAVKSAIDFIVYGYILETGQPKNYFVKDTKTHTEYKTFNNVYSYFEEKFSVSKILKIFYILRLKISISL